MPVAVGRQTPAVPADRIDYQFTWAEDFQAYKPIATPAVEFLADTIRKNPGQVTLIAVGPLQNIGDLVRQHPDVVPLVKRVVLMSGSIGAECLEPGAGGGVERQAGDPGGAGRLRRRMAADHRPARLDDLRAARGSGARDAAKGAARRWSIALEALLRLWTDRPDSRMTLHDQLALAEAQHPGRFFGRCDADADPRRCRGLHACRHGSRPPGDRLPRAETR